MAKLNLFVVQQLVMARTIQDAIRKARKAPITSIFLDDDWKKNMYTLPTKEEKVLGFRGKKK